MWKREPVHKGGGVSKWVQQPGVKGQRDRLMLELLQKASRRTAASDRNANQLKYQRHIISSWNWRVHVGFRLSWAQSSRGVTGHVCVCVCTHVCIHLSHLLVRLLAGWAHSQAGSLGQLQTQAVLLSPRREAPFPSFSSDPCPAPCRPLAHPPLPDGEWRVPVPSLGPVPVPCGEAGGVCDRGPSCRAISQRKRCWEVKIRERSDSWGCWNLKDEQPHPLEVWGCK